MSELTDVVDGNLGPISIDEGVMGVLGPERRDVSVFNIPVSMLEVAIILKQK